MAIHAQDAGRMTHGGKVYGGAGLAGNGAGLSGQ